MSEPDDLYTLRNLFWLGAYQAAINEANSLSRVSQALQKETKEYVYRSYLALGQSNIVISEVKDSAPAPLKAIKALASFVLNGSSGIDSFKSQLVELLATDATNNTMIIIAATLSVYDDNLKEAMSYLTNEKSLEQ